MTILIIVVLLLLGFALITIEAMAPGVHIFGITGLVLVLAGIAYAFWQGPWWGVGTILFSAATFTVIVVVSIKSGAWKRLTLDEEQRRDAGYRSDDAGMDQFLGKAGKVLVDLRPVGYADIDGRRMEVVSENDYVSQGETVQVVAIDGSRLVVRASSDT